MSKHTLQKRIGVGVRGFELGEEVGSSGITSATRGKIDFAYMKAHKRACNWKDANKSTTLNAGYTVLNNALGVNNHIIRFATNVYAGDKVTTAANGTYTVFQSGYYFIFATIWFTFTTVYNAANYATYFPDGYLSVDVFKNGVVVEPAGLTRLPIWIEDINATNHTYPKEWCFTLQNLLYLNQGDYIDIRTNLRNFAGADPISFTFKGTWNTFLYALPNEMAAIRN